MVRLAGFGLMTDSEDNPATRLQTGQFTVGSVGPALIETSGRAPHADTSPCRHDSGAPYFRELNKNKELVALVSSGPACPHRGGDSSARIDNISGWIGATIATEPSGTADRWWLWPAVLAVVVLVAMLGLLRFRPRRPMVVDRTVHYRGDLHGAAAQRDRAAAR
ncbi:hypothetical protein [Paractinoplanes durhamensis]|uniref:hypothetical protein n=1 Tax=Paractinoplanes durhamensis TaxID=113563 RepID=UPI00363ADAF4